MHSFELLQSGEPADGAHQNGPPAADGAVYLSDVANATTGVRKVTNLLGTPSVTTVYNPDNRQVIWIRADRQLSLTDGLNRTTSFAYDRAGNRTGVTDPRGSGFTRTETYDGRDRLTGISAQSSANLSPVSLGYDAIGRRTSLADGTGTTSVQYDALGRMTQLNAPNTGVVASQYNARGDRTKLTYPGTGAPVLDYTYVGDGQLQTVKQSGTTLAEYAYYPAGRLSQVARLQGAAGLTNYQYDGADRLRGVRTTTSGALVASHLYQTDRLGQRTLVTDTLPLNPAPSSTRIRTVTFESGALVDPYSGGTNAYGPVQLDGTASITGGWAARMNAPQSAAVEVFFGPVTGPVDELFVTFYLRITSAPASTLRIAEIYNGSTRVGNLRLTSGRQLQLFNNTTQVGGASPALALQTVYRVQLHQKKKTGTTNNGVLEAFVVAGDTPFGSAFARNTAQSFTTQADYVQVGTLGSVAVDLTFDDLVYSIGGPVGMGVDRPGRTGHPGRCGPSCTVPLP